MWGPLVISTPGTTIIPSKRLSLAFLSLPCFHFLSLPNLLKVYIFAILSSKVESFLLLPHIYLNFDFPLDSSWYKVIYLIAMFINFFALYSFCLILVIGFCLNFLQIPFLNCIIFCWDFSEAGCWFLFISSIEFIVFYFFLLGLW